MNQFGEVENIRVRSDMVAMQDVVNVSAVLLVGSVREVDRSFDSELLARVLRPFL